MRKQTSRPFLEKINRSRPVVSSCCPTHTNVNKMRFHENTIRRISEGRIKVRGMPPRRCMPQLHLTSVTVASDQRSFLKLERTCIQCLAPHYTAVEAESRPPPLPSGQNTFTSIYDRHSPVASRRWGVSCIFPHLCRNMSSLSVSQLKRMRFTRVISCWEDALR